MLIGNVKNLPPFAEIGDPYGGVPILLHPIRDIFGDIGQSGWVPCECFPTFVSAAFFELNLLRNLHDKFTIPCYTGKQVIANEENFDCRGRAGHPGAA